MLIKRFINHALISSLILHLCVALLLVGLNPSSLAPKNFRPPLEVGIAPAQETKARLHFVKTTETHETTTAVTALAVAALPVESIQSPAPPEWTSFSTEVRQLIESHLHYPLSLRRRGVQGRAIIKLVFANDGQPRSIEIAHSSGSPELDQLALESARSVSKWPPVPQSPTPQNDTVLNLPIEFKINP